MVMPYIPFSIDMDFNFVSQNPRQLLINIKAFATRLTFLLILLVQDFLCYFGLTPIQVSLNAWAYFVRFAKYSQATLGVAFSLKFFRPMFTITKKYGRDIFNITRVDAHVKTKFKGNIDNVNDQKKKRRILIVENKTNQMTFLQVLRLIGGCVPSLLVATISSQRTLTYTTYINWQLACLGLVTFIISGTLRFFIVFVF